MMTQAIHKLPVAHRGEIAVRIIHAAPSPGLPAVAAWSEAELAERRRGGEA
jgi:acetyl-CoA carboxylase biotin carboxylase subunit